MLLAFSRFSHAGQLIDLLCCLQGDTLTWLIGVIEGDFCVWRGGLLVEPLTNTSGVRNVYWTTVV
jgi:hypothetical protein